ncbi:ubiquinol-cytochrome c reductase complex 17 kd protein [Aspergillus californicus]
MWLSPTLSLDSFQIQVVLVHGSVYLVESSDFSAVFEPSWVMLDEKKGFVHLPNERLLYTSPPRTSLALQPPSSYTGTESLSLQSSTGRVYLTNQRIVYVPGQKTTELESFSAPLLNLHDSHVSSPFFGPNTWNAIVQPVPGGGISPSLFAVQLKLTFKDGGAYDFHNQFELIKERLQQAVEISGESGRGTGTGNLNMASVHLEDLPAYSNPPGDSNTSSHTLNPTRHSPTEINTGPEPQEPPPGYEEVQQQSVANELEDRLRRAS